MEFTSKIPNFEKLNAHDIIDLRLFYALYKNAISYLITEDKKVHAWANIFGIESCYNISDALEFFRELTAKPEEVFRPIPIEKKPLHNLKLEDSFFDDLREDYGKDSFEKWYKKKAKQGNEAYVYLNSDKTLGAFLMLKEEDELINSKPEVISKNKRIKICTLKVSKIRNKIGELFLNIAFNFAIKNEYDEIYLTHFIKEDDYLVPLIEKYGFVKSKNYLEHDYTDKKEAIFIKKLKIDEDVEPEILRNQYFPSFYDGTKNRKFIVPIKPIWHGRLFPDLRKQTFLKEHEGEFCIEGNTIQKAYLCHSHCKQMKQGDLVLFYRSEQDQKITVIGSIDQVHYSIKNPEEVTKLVGKRTVYSLSEIKQLTDKKALTIILFKYHFPLPNQLKTSKLIDKKIIKAAPQSIIELNQSNYLRLKREAKIPIEFTKWD